MAELQDKSSSSIWVGHKLELRKSYRRQTMAEVVLSGIPESCRNGLVTNISMDGAYLKVKLSASVGDIISLKLLLPTGMKKPIEVTGRVVRIDQSGFGLRFEELQSRDRAKIRQYAGFVELDEVIVDLQNGLRDIIPGNLLPVSEWPLIEERLLAASNRRLKVLVVSSIKSNQYIEARLSYGEGSLNLRDLQVGLPAETKVVYCIIVDGPLNSVFEGLLMDNGIAPRLALPERMYHNERRWSRRELVHNTWMIMQAPHAEDGEVRLPVIDLSEGGCAILAPKESFFAPGMRFPNFQVVGSGLTLKKEGATVARITQQNGNGWLLGMNFLDQIKDRDAFASIQDRSLRSTIWSNLIRYSSMARQRIAKIFVKKQIVEKERVCLVRYKNPRGDMVAALLDATFDLNEDAPDVDVAVIIGPPFPVRKEVFGLLARTLIDNFRHQGLNAVVCRFDMTHALGESEVDPEMEAKGHPYLRWTYSLLESDMRGSMSYLERRFKPKKRVMVSYSVAAIAARRMIADQHEPPVDLFIAPFGCPDGQDMFKNLLAGVDLFPIYQRGEKAEPFLIYGRLSDPSGVLPDAMARGMAFLEDARKDMEKITIPVVWLVGTYDFMVTRSRVRQMLNAPGGGIREIIELPAGHNPKIGAEAIESFKLIYESIGKHLYGLTKSAVEPDLALYEKQREVEWARTKRKKFSNATEFWDRHLFGTSDEKEGYDVLLFNPDYVDFMDHQVKALDVVPGLRVADIGCGTGNFTVSMLKHVDLRDKPLELTCMDLVPGAIDCTHKKVETILNDSSDRLSKLQYRCCLVDLESTRLKAWQEYLSGKLYGLRALIDRVEGLHGPTIRKIEEHYSPEVHKILRGELSSSRVVKKLIPELDESEVETVLELSMASRFLQGQTVPDDLMPGIANAETAADLRFRQLAFGHANQNGRLHFADSSFDRIGGSLVLPYLYDPLSVLEELYRILAPGGVLVLSSLKPNFDSSKSYLEEAVTISEREDLAAEERDRLLASLREFSAFVGSLIELEDEGRFRFFAADELVHLVREAGFVNVRVSEAFGDPPTAVVVRAERAG